MTYGKVKIIRLKRKEPKTSGYLKDLLKNWGATWRN
jgi:hypothetical protein